MDHANQNQIIVASADADAASTNNVDQRESPPPYLKLIADCWEHIFDYLSLEDIHAMGETCKRMHQMAGYYIRECLPDQYLYLIEDSVRTNILSTSFQLRKDYWQYIRKLKVGEKQKRPLDADKFRSLKKLIFDVVRLSRTQVKYARHVLKNAEIVYLTHCDIYDPESIEKLVNYCSKLKQLIIRNSDTSHYVDRSIFSQHIPELEHFEYLNDSPRPIDGLKTFLEKHANKLKSFETYYDFLSANRDSLIKTNNIQLDVLAVHADNKDIPFDQLVVFLKALHARGFYKSLHLKIDDNSEDIDIEHVTNIIATLPGLEMWTSYENAAPLDLSRLVNLKELQIETNTDFDLEDVAKGLTQLERLGVHDSLFTGLIPSRWGSFIDPFIRYSKSLKSIKLSGYSGYSYHDNFDFFALNEERKKLDGACRIVLYLREDVYLRTKWISRNINLSHIEVRRIESLTTN